MTIPGRNEHDQDGQKENYRVQIPGPETPYA